MPEERARDESALYHVNGHRFIVETEHGGDVVVECRDCMVKELVQSTHDPEEHLELMTPECHVEWLREPDGGFRGVALRNASGFSGRELIAVNEAGEVTDRVRVYDDDAPVLSSMLDKSNWGDRR